MTIAIRPMLESDLTAVAALNTLLDAHASPEGVARRLTWLGLRAAHSNGFFVACVEARGSSGRERETDGDCTVVGWVHVHGVCLLETIAYAEIGGVVVDAAHRRRGIGRRLVDRCEAWARERAYAIIRLRPPRAPVPDAAPFYQQLGYEAMRTRALFHKSIAPA